ncbi:copper resistance CopC family protein [Leifsonia sp. SIMBA_070]|uniref:copper resistance CopC family protein n=1 Tax=Leifsonia sp. SIMBA_070 TaxID=3085810 RepID=UPI00397B0C64
MRNRLLAATAGLAAAVALALAPVAAAEAHDYLVGSDPTADSTVTSALDTVTLTFNDRVLDLSGKGSTNLLTVTGPGSGTRHFETGCATVADTKLSAPVALGGAGKYTVTYQIVSADGHTVSSSYGFSYQPPAGATAAAGADATPCGTGGSGGSGGSGSDASPGPTGSGAGATPAATAAASTPQPTAASSGTDLGLVIGIGIAIVVLAVIGVVIVLVTARRKPAAADDPADDPSRRD